MEPDIRVKTYKFILGEITDLYNAGINFTKVYKYGSRKMDRKLTELDVLVDDHLRFAERVLPLELYQKLMNEKVVSDIIELIGT